MNEPRWRLEQLVDRVGRVLSEEGPGGESRRVRWMPDARTARYYTTLGLLSRPAEMRGRTAYYGVRHLLELLTIKRLQSQGCSLEEVQRRLAGQPEDVLRELARAPEWALQPGPEEGLTGAGGSARAAFWQAAPSAPALVEEPCPDGCAAAVAVRLAPGATLILELPPEALGPGQVRAIRDSARELLALLGQLGLDVVDDRPA